MRETKFREVPEKDEKCQEMLPSPSCARRGGTQTQTHFIASFVFFCVFYFYFGKVCPFAVFTCMHTHMTLWKDFHLSRGGAQHGPEKKQQKKPQKCVSVLLKIFFFTIVRVVDIFIITIIMLLLIIVIRFIFYVVCMGVLDCPAPHRPGEPPPLQGWRSTSSPGPPCAASPSTPRRSSSACPSPASSCG